MPANSGHVTDLLSQCPQILFFSLAAPRAEEIKNELLEMRARARTAGPGENSVFLGGRPPSKKNTNWVQFSWCSRNLNGACLDHAFRQPEVDQAPWHVEQPMFRLDRFDSSLNVARNRDVLKPPNLVGLVAKDPSFCLCFWLAKSAADRHIA